MSGQLTGVGFRVTRLASGETIQVRNVRPVTAPAPTALLLLLLLRRLLLTQGNVSVLPATHSCLLRADLKHLKDLYVTVHNHFHGLLLNGE